MVIQTCNRTRYDPTLVQVVGSRKRDDQMTRQSINPFDTPGKLDPEIIADPYPRYHQLRAKDPVHWNEWLQGWCLTRYADVLNALRDHRFSVDRMSRFRGRLPETMQTPLAPIMGIFSNMMLMSDPPNHTRLRLLANKAFTPRVVDNMRAHIQAIVDQSLDAVEGARRIDIISDLANTLPATVICEMLGVPAKDHKQFKSWSDDVAMFLGGTRLAARHARDAQRSALDMIDYLKGIIKECRQNPRDDLISALVTAEDQGDVFSEAELDSMFVLLQIGGQNTANLIGTGLLTLLQNPEQMQQLKSDPSLITTAVEEFIRYHSPVQMATRIATEDMEIGGKEIFEGQVVTAYIGAANRDPAQFPDPDHLEITRQENRHVGFGFGPHFCLGGALARLEGQIAIGTVIARLPGLQLEAPLSAEGRPETFPWRDNPIFRGLDSLPLVF